MTTHRLQFSELPRPIRARLETELGAPVVGAAHPPGGYSPSMAAACRLADGRQVFVKAVSADQNPDSPVMLRREAGVAARLPPAAPAPRLLSVLDDGHWVVVVYEHVDGRLPRLPWTRAELARVMDATVALSRLEAPDGLPTISDVYSPILDGWRKLASAPDPAIDPWARRHLDRLADREPEWEAAMEGSELVHGDVRSDNVLLAGGRVVFVDWPAGCIGRAVFDVACMLPSVELEGGPAVERLAEEYLAGAEPEVVTSLVLAATGYFLDRGRLPDPPGLPTVRAFQRDQAAVCLRWLKGRLGWS